MKQKHLILIGNGFNRMVADWTGRIHEEKPTRTELRQLQEQLLEISDLWKRFDIIFQEFSRTIPGMSPERIIAIIHVAIEFLSKIRQITGSNSIDALENIKKELDHFILESVLEVVQEFINHQHDRGYGLIKMIYPKFGIIFYDLLNKYEPEWVKIYTTNYDGYLPTLLTGSDYNHFLFADGFADGKESPSGMLNIYKTYLDSKFGLYHMHGSYLYSVVGSQTYKLKIAGENRSPSIIFNSPSLKEKLINDDTVLSTYYTNFINQCTDCDNLILIGNAMTEEPHILKALTNNLNKAARIHIINRSPDKVDRILKDHGITNDIQLIPTSFIKSPDDFFKILEGILTP